MPDPQTPKFVTEERFAAVGQQIVDVLGRVEKELQSTRARAAGAPAPKAPESGAQPATPAAAPSNAQAILEALLAGNDAPLQEFVRKAAATAKDPRVDQLESLAVRSATERVAENQERARARVDGKFGPGTYDKHVAPALASKFDGREALQSDRSYFDNAVSLVLGEKFDDLRTELTTAEKAREEAAAAAAKEKTEMQRNWPYMLDGGVPFSRAGAPAFDAEDEKFIAKFENNMSEKFDRDRSIKLLQTATEATRQANSPFMSVSIDQLNKAFETPKGAQ